MSATVDLLTTVPPAFVVIAVALVIPFVSDRVGHTIGFVASLGVVPWALALRSSPGDYIQTAFMGFDVVLLNIDAFSVVMAVIFGGFGAVAVAYSYYVDASRIQTAFAVSYVGTSVGAVLVGDWLTLVFFWELMAVTSTLLVWYYGGKAVRAGYRYALLHGAGGSLLMSAVVLNYVQRGAEGFVFTGEGMASGLPAVLAALGIGVNVGFIGLHAWIPDTYPRPGIGASVFLCAFTTKAGVYGLYRAFPDGNVALAYMGAGMTVYGVVYALLQTDMRRLLAYHIQAQVGYMVGGIGMTSALATAGGFAHVFNHILYKGLLFMTAGVLIYRTGENSLKKLGGGLWRRTPVTAGAFAVAALSISGFPGFNGFVSKGMITAAAGKTQRYVVGGQDILWWLMMLGAVGTFMSFVKFGYYAFVKGSYEGKVRDGNIGQKLTVSALAVACFVLGVAPGLLFGILPLSDEWTAHPFTTGHLLEGFTLAALGIAGFYVARGAISRIGVARDVDSVYNPGVFYGTRAVARFTTMAYTAVDSGAVRLAGFCTRAVNQPAETARRLLPEGARETYDERVAKKPGETGTRAGIGETVLMLSLVLAVVMYLFL
ncbi:Na(+)/H(+) antiporter subunit D [Haladaptatus sp. F3-133]|uniref:Na(+)/H(+) antiporter subunit D n=1 Tax=Halorutilus salinus TaxID=2487751 RepID=A0A9Q4C6U3_9EURY|nr:Na(+)/H(+) antiporter subunit D [Halorutilus salinus]MCX2819346.1 Na(+)/H(+) antiporter subunit D [Halorutilus salinus]